MSFIEDKWAWMDNMDEEELKCTIVRMTNEHKQQVAELKKRGLEPHLNIRKKTRVYFLTDDDFKEVLGNGLD